MFFATDVTLPFDSLRDVLKVFPTWNLVYMYGNSAYFEVPASQVKHTYSISNCSPTRSIFREIQIIPNFGMRLKRIMTNM